MAPKDLREFDRLYDRLIERLAGPARPRPQADALSIAELQAFMDRVRAQECETRDTDPMPSEGATKPPRQ